jgi:hypothetical protein
LSLLGRRLRGPPPTPLWERLYGRSVLAPRPTGPICLSHFVAGLRVASRASLGIRAPRGGSINQWPPFADPCGAGRRCECGCCCGRHSARRRGVSSQATTQKRQSDRAHCLDPEFNAGPKRSQAAVTSGSPEPERTPHADPRRDAMEARKLSPAASSSHDHRASADADDPQTARRPCQY